MKMLGCSCWTWNGTQIFWLLATNNASRLIFSNINNRTSDDCRCIRCKFNWSLFRINSCIICKGERTWCRVGKGGKILTDPSPFFYSIKFPPAFFAKNITNAHLFCKERTASIFQCFLHNYTIFYIYVLERQTLHFCWAWLHRMILVRKKRRAYTKLYV